MAASRSPSSFVASLTVLAVAVGFLAYAFDRPTVAGGSYDLHASFVSANGLAGGSKVALAGVQVGEVRQVVLDPHTMAASVTFSMSDQLRLPADSRVAIASTGLTSPNQLVITPGHAPTRLADGATITDTQDYVSLEQQIGQYIFGGGASALQ